MPGNALVKNAGDEEQVAKATDRKESAKHREAADYKFVLSTREGRRFLARLLHEDCKFNDKPYGDDGVLAYMAGVRGVGTSIFRKALDSDPEKAALMLVEHTLDERVTNGR